MVIVELLRGDPVPEIDVLSSGRSNREVRVVKG
jgi:hypothetical protein